MLDRMAERLKATARAPRPAPRDRRAPVWLDQAMDEPGRLPDAGPRQCPRRVQPDRARLQSPPSAQYPRRRSDDRGRPSMKGAQPLRTEQAGSTCPSGADFSAQPSRHPLSRNRFHTVCLVCERDECRQIGTDLVIAAGARDYQETQTPSWRLGSVAALVDQLLQRPRMHFAADAVSAEFICQFFDPLRQG